jgi:dipeptidase E
MERSARRQIIAMGGGGFLMEPENPLLDRYVLAATGKEKPNVCFVPTPVGDRDETIVRFYRAFAAHECRMTHLSLFKGVPRDLRAFILAQDLIYVSGGNTKSALGVWREWGLDAIFREALEQGTVLCGVSAGAVCWFEDALTDSWPGIYTRLPALGLQAGSFSPHYDRETGRRGAFHKQILKGTMPEGWAADEGVALHFVEGLHHATVASRRDVKGWRLERKPHRNGFEIVEHALEATFLGL